MRHTFIAPGPEPAPVDPCRFCGETAAAGDHGPDEECPTLWPGVQFTEGVLIGARTSVCGPADLNGKDSVLSIGPDCDIAAFVTINCADSHTRAVGLSRQIERKRILIDHHVFVGTGAVILGGCVIGHHTVIGAGVVLKNRVVPAYSRVRPAEAVIDERFYENGPSKRRAVRRVPE